jgi:hypothetical protein
MFRLGPCQRRRDGPHAVWADAERTSRHCTGACGAMNLGPAAIFATMMVFLIGAALCIGRD